jgi:hypothetical protein
VSYANVDHSAYTCRAVYLELIESALRINTINFSTVKIDGEARLALYMHEDARKVIRNIPPDQFA